VGVGDGGAGGDPFDMAQDPASGFGKLHRIDPLGSDGTTGEYGIPAGNPYAGDDDPATLGEIFALGFRNRQNFAWDPASGAMFVADIGQSTVEEVSVVTAGANLGWNDWEGSFRFNSEGGVFTDDARSDPEMTYPVAEYDQQDPLLTQRTAVTGLHVTRSDRIPGLSDQVLFGDLATGEIFAFDADDLSDGGQDALRRVLLRSSGGEPRTLLELMREKNAEQGRSAAERTDLRIDGGPDGRIFLLNKHDGTIREIVPGGG
jgi:glucose/arabinose dehydrogenase